MALTTDPQRPSMRHAQRRMVRRRSFWTNERTMTPAQRCDEIIRLIDEALQAGAEPVTKPNRRQEGRRDRRLVGAGPGNRNRH